MSICNCFRNPLMRASGEPVLEPARERVAQCRQPVPRLRDSLEFVMNFLALRIEGEQKAFLALLNVQGSRSIYETERFSIPRDIDELAQVQRPQPQSMDLHHHGLANRDQGFWIRGLDPTEIELHPLFKGMHRRLEQARTTTQSGAGTIMNETER